jgi:hypothetical protein
LPHLKTARYIHLEYTKEIYKAKKMRKNWILTKGGCDSNPKYSGDRSKRITSLKLIEQNYQDPVSKTR